MEFTCKEVFLLNSVFNLIFVFHEKENKLIFYKQEIVQ